MSVKQKTWCLVIAIITGISVWGLSGLGMGIIAFYAALGTLVLMELNS